MDDEAELAERMEELAQQLTVCQGQMDTLRDTFLKDIKGKKSRKYSQLERKSKENVKN